ncbi:hypothetical protein EDB85DRAFT_1892750 [Lactarius pseudohatsudake]|nr:hypothetical protein EDB85DRAFT_1892750 [Lactarius pseudohatsudake]
MPGGGLAETLRLLHLHHRAPLTLARLPQRQHQEQDPVPTSPVHFPSIQAPRPEPTTTLPQRAQPEKVDGRGEGDMNIDSSSSDEDDFDGGLDTRVWNHTGALLCFLSFVRASARTSSSSSRTPALAVSLTYLPAITLLGVLASPLLVSIASEHAHGPVASCDAALWSQPPASLLCRSNILLPSQLCLTTVAGVRVIMTAATATAVMTGGDNGDEATVTTATTATRQPWRSRRGNCDDRDNCDKATVTTAMTTTMVTRQL